MSELPAAQYQHHFPVMLREVIDILDPNNDGTYLDATFGSGAHTVAILDSVMHCHVIAIDRDESVESFVEHTKRIYGERFSFFNERFSKISMVLKNTNVAEIDGALFDVGVSSMQIDDPKRGFSFNNDGPLAMTMGKNEISAYNVINEYSENEIANILFEYGEEKESRRIAAAICMSRLHVPIATTLQLANIVSNAKRQHSKKIHPATLTFQALRVYVNDELSELRNGLMSAIQHLAIGGKVVVITFQGLEDIVVKATFKHFTARQKINKYRKPAVLLMSKLYKNMTCSAVRPSVDEKKQNPRSRSAKIRTLMRIE